MQFLCVAERELRTAARKPGSYRMRVLTSALALFLAAFSLWFVTLLGSRPMPGSDLFSLLSWAALACACLAGPALTADSINEERNQGTLGLLFLTNLPTESIIAGKLAGHGLLAFYAILAIVPVMALPVLLGGADAPSLAKTALVLINTLSFSLIVGLLASTLWRTVWKAAAAALVILGLFVIGIPMASAGLRLAGRPEWAVVLELLSPSYTLQMADSFAAMWPGNQFWPALGAQALLSLLVLGLVRFVLPRAWRESSGSGENRLVQLSTLWRERHYGAGEGRRRLRIHLLRINPILWLSSRERFGPAGSTLVLGLLALGICWIGPRARFGAASGDFMGPMAAWIGGLPVLYLLFCFRLATAASERFALDRKTGAFELILCTPLKTGEILRGHWLGLIRRLWGGAALLFALHLFALNYIIEAIRIEAPLPNFDLPTAIRQSLIHVFVTTSIPNAVAPFYVACWAVLAAAVLIVVLWISLGWLAIALSLKLRREILAPWIALFLLAIPPLPLFICSIPIAGNHNLFARDLFLGLLTLGGTGFSMVLANALAWLFLARRWTYQQLGRRSPRTNSD